VLGYGHGDVIRGLEPQWYEGLDPWTLTRRGDRLYGRGTAGHKGQHSINLAALDGAENPRRLGFNARMLIETGEGGRLAGIARGLPPAQGQACRRRVDRLGRAAPGAGPADDLSRARGAMNFDLVVDLREGGHHSGNWGGLLANPG